MITKLLSDLVRFRTLSNDYAENRRTLNWIKKQLQGLPVYFEFFSVNKHPALVISTKKTKRPQILLQGHIDIVGGPEHLFQPKVSNGILIGRGVFDMKYAIACYIRLFQELGQKLSQFNIAIMITTDEELGGHDGVEALVNRGFRPQVCFLPDGGQDWILQRSAKGILQFRAISRGISGHSSRPWTGDNAIDKLNLFIAELRNEFVVEPCKDKNHAHDTMTVSHIQGGQTINQIPDFARADIDIRFTPDKTLTQMLGLVRNIASRLKGIEILETSSGFSCKVDTSNKDYKMFLNMMKKRKLPIKFMDSHGSSDARYFLDKKIPCIILRPLGGGHHTDREWINIKELGKFYSLLKEFVLSR